MPEQIITDREWRQLRDLFDQYWPVEPKDRAPDLLEEVMKLLAQARREGREEEKSHCGHHFDLRAVDALARAVDDAVKEGHIDARSRIADARLDYGEPFKYEHTPPAPEGEKP